MKRILFVIPSLSHGGTNKALENMLKTLNGYDYNISIYSIIYDKNEPYYNVFKANLIKPVNKWIQYLITPLKESKYYFFKCLLIKLLRTFFKTINKDLTISLCKKTGDKISLNNYDIVIGFQEGIATTLANYIKSKKLIAWVHCDYSVVPQDYKYLYYNFNNIVCVSKYTKGTFDKILNGISEKSLYIHNIVDPDIIINKSKKINDLNIIINKEKFNIISVGRIDYIKRFKEIPSIADELIKNNIEFHWYIVGDYNTNEGHELLNNIKIYNMEKYITLTGATSNPYVIMSKCDLYVCLSISEACPYVINEAKILHLPIISTNFPSINEFINNGKEGFICEFDNISDMIIKIVNSPKLYERIKTNINEFRYDNNILEKSIIKLFNYEK